MSEGRAQKVTKRAENGQLIKHIKDLGCGHEWDIPPTEDKKDKQGRFVCPECNA